MEPNQQPQAPITQPPSEVPQQIHKPVHQKGANGMAIAGMIFAILLPLLGLILSIIGLNKSKKLGQGTGLPLAGIITSSVLLIISIPVGIVIGLTLTTFSGIQQKARDTERRTDINALHGHIEAYYASSGMYPTYANINDNTFRSINFAGLDNSAYADAQSPDKITLSNTAGGSYTYSYSPKPEGCNNKSTICSSYILSTKLEAGGTYTKQSLNNL